MSSEEVAKAKELHCGRVGTGNNTGKPRSNCVGKRLRHTVAGLAYSDHQRARERPQRIDVASQTQLTGLIEHLFRKCAGDTALGQSVLEHLPYHTPHFTKG